MQRIRREKARPFLPNVLLNGFQTPYEMIQAGIFGIGPNSSLNQWRGRFDFSIQPLWQLEALGIGNLARIKEQRGIESHGDHRLLQDPGHGGGGRDPGRGAGPVGGGPGRSRPTAPCARPSSPSTAPSRACSRPPALATSWSWSTGRRKRSSPSSS